MNKINDVKVGDRAQLIEPEPLVEEARRAMLDELLRRCKAAGYTYVEITAEFITAGPRTSAKWPGQSSRYAEDEPSALSEIVVAMGLRYHRYRSLGPSLNDSVGLDRDALLCPEPLPAGDWPL